MAFFPNHKPNAVAGVSLPTDGSDVLTLHLIRHGTDGTTRTTYDEDRKFFGSMEGAQVFSTPGGCLIMFKKTADINTMLLEVADYFDEAMTKAVEEKRRTNWWEKSLKIRIDMETLIRASEQVVSRFGSGSAANTSRPFKPSVVNIRTYLATLGQ